MKVFWLKKSNREDISQMFRSNNFEKNISTIDVNRNSSFRALTIANPSDSKCICSIDGLQFNTSVGTKLWLFMDEANNQAESLGTAGILSIYHSQTPALSKHNIEILEEIHTANKLSELTSENYAILLPGGCLTIITEKDLLDAELTINWNTEEF